MKLLEILQALGALSALVAAGLLFTFRLGAKGERVTQAPKDVAARLDKFEERFDRVSAEASELATSVQGLVGDLDDLKRRHSEDHRRLRLLSEFVNAQPVSLSTTFFTRREAEVIVQESRTDRERLHREIESIWNILRKERL